MLHFKRLKRAYKRGGAKALASQRRGRRSNNQLPTELKICARELLRSKYPDFGPIIAINLAFFGLIIPTTFKGADKTQFIQRAR